MSVITPSFLSITPFGVVVDSILYGLKSDGYDCIDSCRMTDFFKERLRDTISFCDELGSVFLHQSKKVKTLARQYIVFFDHLKLDTKGKVLSRMVQAINQRQPIIASFSLVSRLFSSDGARVVRLDILDPESWVVLSHPQREMVYLLPRYRSFASKKMTAVFIAGHGASLMKSKEQWVIASIRINQMRIFLKHLDSVDVDSVSCSSCSSGKTCLWELVNNPEPLEISYPLVVHSIADYKTKFPVKINFDKYFLLLENYFLRPIKRVEFSLGSYCIKSNRLSEEPVVYIKRKGIKPLNLRSNLLCIDDTNQNRVIVTHKAVCFYTNNWEGEIYIDSSINWVPRFLSMTPEKPYHKIRCIMIKRVSIIEFIKKGLAYANPNFLRRSMTQYNPRDLDRRPRKFYIREAIIAGEVYENLLVESSYRIKSKKVVLGMCLFFHRNRWLYFARLSPIFAEKDNFSGVVITDNQAQSIISSFFIQTGLDDVKTSQSDI